MKNTKNNTMPKKNCLNTRAVTFWNRSLSVGFAGMAILMGQAFAGEKPSEWDSTVRAAGKTAPTFWLDGNYSLNKGSELAGDVNYVHENLVFDALQPNGFWGEKGGAFRIANANSVAKIGDSKTTNIGCSESGSLAILFKTASEFRFGGTLPPDKHALFIRGENSTPSPFEVAVVNGSIRVSTLGSYNQCQFTTIADVKPSSWYWFAVSWMKEGGITHVKWRVLDLANSSSAATGEFQTSGLGDQNRLIMFGVTQSKHSVADTEFSQIIVWDSPVETEGWSKIEKLLK